MTQQQAKKIVRFGQLAKYHEMLSATSVMETIEITWSELKALRDGGLLTAGQWYRITDYTCTTTQTDTQSAGHQFDIIVRADDVNVLNENAFAAHHAGDTYFANSKLEAWKLLYCLDNDTDRFGWADSTNGKGVIYRMIDEWNNDVPYDFKNIQFKRYKTTKSGAFYDGMYFGFQCMGDNYPSDANLNMNDAKYFLTFSRYTSGFSTIEDMSLNSNGIDCYNNKIFPLFDEYGDYFGVEAFALSNIVFETNNGSCSSNTFKSGCVYFTFGNECNSNTFGGGCASNTFGGSCSNNTFGNGCASNTFGNGCNSNTFGNGCYSNTFGDGCYQNTFGNSCYSNTFGNSCYQNIFGNDCSNTFGNYCSCNTFGNSCSSNTFGNSCERNTFGDDCEYIKLGTSSTAKDYCQYIIVENGNQWLYLDCSATTSDSAYFQNVKIAQGVNNTSTYKTITHTTAGDTFQTVYKPANSVEVSV